MGRSNYVRIYRMQERLSYVENGYELKPHGRLAWLHRFLWWALLKLDALNTSMTERVDVLRLPIDNGEVFHRILEARHGLFDVRRQPRRVLIGPETLSELIGCPEVRDWMGAFEFNAPACRDGKIFDLPIEVVPQMEGVVVLTDDAHRA